MKYEYVVLGRESHFQYSSETNQVFCTHGGWGGKLHLFPNGACAVDLYSKTVEYKCYKFTKASSLDSAVNKGLIEGREPSKSEPDISLHTAKVTDGTISFRPSTYKYKVEFEDMGVVWQFKDMTFMQRLFARWFLSGKVTKIEGEKR
jgi:hypothetical protein